MFTFSGIIVFTLLTSALSGTNGLPIEGSTTIATTTTTETSNSIQIQSVEHVPSECTPSVQAEQNNLNTHDTACILEGFDSSASNQLQLVSTELYIVTMCTEAKEVCQS